MPIRNEKQLVPDSEIRQYLEFRPPEYEYFLLNREHVKQLLALLVPDTDQTDPNILNWVNRVYYNHVIRNWADYASHVVSYSIKPPIDGMCEYYYTRGFITVEVEFYVRNFVEPPIRISPLYHNFEYVGPRQEERQERRSVETVTLPIDSWEVKQLQTYSLNRYPKYLSVQSIGEVIEITDWMRACPQELPRDITRLSYAQAMDKQRAWHQRQLVPVHIDYVRTWNLGSGKTNDPGDRVQIEIPDADCKIWLLRDEQALKYEGAIQHHCVAGYWYKVKQGWCAILRFDFTETARYTVEVGVNVDSIKYWEAEDETCSTNKYCLGIRQIRGPCNKTPSSEHYARIERLCSSKLLTEKVIDDIKQKASLR